MSLPHRRRRERVLIAVISALVGGALASAAFVVLSSSDTPLPAPLALHEIDDAGPRPLATPNLAKATSSTEVPPADRF